MLTTRVKTQLVIFCVIAALGITYVAANYVGLGRLVGLSGYSVSVTMPRTGGLFENAEVTYRGVPVGRVTGLDAGPEGVVATFIVTDGDYKIPQNSEVFVRNRSAIGEQYLDIRPLADDGPYLGNGDELSAAPEDLPLPLDNLMTNVVDFTRSVPIDKLRTVVDEFYVATRRSGRDIASLLDASISFLDQASDNLGVTTSLITAAEPVLQTQADSAEDISSFSTDLATIADTLASEDESVRDIISATPGAAREIDALFKQIGQPLTTLMGDLITLNGVLGNRSSELEDVLINAPMLISQFDRSLTSSGLTMGITTNFTNPLPCTNGYIQNKRSGLQTSDVPLMLTDGCASGPARGASSAPNAK